MMSKLCILLRVLFNLMPAANYAVAARSTYGPRYAPATKQCAITHSVVSGTRVGLISLF